MVDELGEDRVRAYAGSLNAPPAWVRWAWSKLWEGARQRSDREVLALLDLMYKAHSHASVWDDAEQALEGSSLAPPPDWIIHTRQVFDGYRMSQRVVRRGFGLDAPLASVDEIAPLLTPYLHDDEQSGDRSGHPLALSFPQSSTDPYSPLSSKYAELYAARPAVSVLVYADGERRQYLKRPLFDLAQLSGNIAIECGVSQSDAVAFLLADKVPERTWMRRKVRQTGRGALQVEIIIGSTAVRPDEVADFYRRILAEVADLDVAEGFNRSRITDKVAACVAFVDDWKRRQGFGDEYDLPRGSWPRIHAEWVTAYPQWADWKLASMRAQYLREAAKRRKGADNGKA